MVILSPTEISCNGDPKNITDIYVRYMPKTKYYEKFHWHGIKNNIFASLEDARHHDYKKLVSSLYLKAAIYSPKKPFQAFIVEKIRDVVKKVLETSVTGQSPAWQHARLEQNARVKCKPKHSDHGIGMEIYSLFGALTMDVVSAFDLGVENGTSFLVNKSEYEILTPHRMQSYMAFWSSLASFLGHFRRSGCQGCFCKNWDLVIGLLRPSRALRY